MKFKQLIIIGLFVSVSAKSQQIIFSETFESYPVGTVGRSTFSDNWNLRSLVFGNGSACEEMSIVDVGGSHGHVWKLPFCDPSVLDPSNSNKPYSETHPLTTNYCLLDSLYTDLWISWDKKLSNPFDGGNGGKELMFLGGGKYAMVPHIGDTVNDAYEAVRMWKSSTGLAYPVTMMNYPRSELPLDQYHYAPIMNSNTTGASYVYGRMDIWNWNSSGGYWFGYPSYNKWGGSSWVPDDDKALFGSIATSSDYHNYACHIRLSTGGAYHDILEFYDNGVCTFVDSTMNFRSASHDLDRISNFGLLAFFGGSEPVNAYFCYWLIDNMLIRYNTPTDPDYSPYARHLGDIITIPTSPTKYITTSARPADEWYRNTTGTVHSFQRAFYRPVDNVTCTKWIAPANASYIDYTMTDYQSTRGDDQLASSSQDYVKIYKYNSGSSTLVYTWNHYNKSSATFHMVCDSAKLVYFSGIGRKFDGYELGWTGDYTSDGDAGTNPHYASKSEMQAKQYGIAAVGTSPPAPPITPSCDSSVVTSDTTYVYDSIMWNFENTLTSTYATGIYSSINLTNHSTSFFTGHTCSGSGSYTLSTDGSGYYVTSSTSMNLGDVFTIDFYCKAYALYNKVIFANNNGSGTGFNLQYNSTYNNLLFITTNGTDIDSANTTANTWTTSDCIHLRIDVNKSWGSCHMYANDVEVTSDTTIRTDFSTNNIFAIGDYNTGGNSNWWAYYDDFKIVGSYTGITYDTICYYVSNKKNISDTLFGKNYDFASSGVRLQYISPDSSLGYFDTGQFFGFDSVDFSPGYNYLRLKYVSHPDYTGNVLITLDSLDGDTLAYFHTVSTGGWSTYGLQDIAIDNSITGIHSLYFQSDGVAVMIFDWILGYDYAFSRYFHYKPMIYNSSKAILKYGNRYYKSD